MSDIKTTVRKNNDGTITFETKQDVQGILEQNMREANDNANRKKEDTFGRKVASIPLNILNAWCKEWGITLQQLNKDPAYKARMMARLRDRDYLKLRTDHGKI